MRLYPESATVQLEFDKIRNLLAQHCQSEYARSKASQLRIHTRIDFVQTELRQSHEYNQLLRNGIYFPNDYILNLAAELKLLAIPGAVLSGEQLMQIRRLAELKTRLWDDYQIEVPLVGWNGGHYIRVSIQCYNSPNDVDRLLEALKRLL